MPKLATREHMLPELIEALDQGGYGPAMMALTERQRAWVIAMFQTGMKSKTQAARMAGVVLGDGVYSGEMRRAAYVISQNPKVQAAMLEYGKGAFRAMAPKAMEEMARIALKGKSESVRLAASREILDRGGFAPTINVAHKHEVTVSYDEKLLRLKELVRRNGGDPEVVVAGLARPEEPGPPVTDAEYEEVGE